MVFRSLRRALGVGGPAVDTVLHDPHIRPGASIVGDVRLTGGERDVEIERIVVALVTRAETQTVEFARLTVTGGFRLAAGELRAVPLDLPAPWRTPITHLYGQRLPGMAVGLRTELEVARAVDKGDLDFVTVHPLPAQAAALDALVALGFGFKSAELTADLTAESGPGLRQRLEFWAAPQFQDRVGEVGVGFLTDADELELIIEGRDASQSLRIRHDQAAKVDWAHEIDRRMRQIGQF